MLVMNCHSNKQLLLLDSNENLICVNDLCTSTKVLKADLEHLFHFFPCGWLVPRTWNGLVYVTAAQNHFTIRATSINQNFVLQMTD